MSAGSRKWGLASFALFSPSCLFGCPNWSLQFFVGGVGRRLPDLTRPILSSGPHFANNCLSGPGAGQGGAVLAVAAVIRACSFDSCSADVAGGCLALVGTGQSNVACSSFTRCGTSHFTSSPFSLPLYLVLAHSLWGTPKSFRFATVFSFFVSNLLRFLSTGDGTGTELRQR